MRSWKGCDGNMSKCKKVQGVVLLEVEFLKVMSYQKKVVVEVVWFDMLLFLFLGDLMQFDWVKVSIGSGFVDDDMIFDSLQVLIDYMWQVFYGGEEWILVQVFVMFVQKSLNVISVRIFQ